MLNLASFYSQNFEDVLLSRIFADTEFGTYVDVGCQSELQHSVTRHFYERGWSGINIDPVAEYIEEYAHRERDISLNLAAGSKVSKSLLTVIVDSGLSSFHETHINWAHNYGHDQTQERWVEVSTLNLILEEYLPSKNQISFLKIDVEGHELEVLKGIDLSRYRPIVILVETTKSGTTDLVDNFSDISRHICSNSYDQVYFDGLNTWWLATEQKEHRLHYFSFPVGYFDGFNPFEIRRLLLSKQEMEQTKDIRDITVRRLFNSILRRLSTLKIARVPRANSDSRY